MSLHPSKLMLHNLSSMKHTRSIQPYQLLFCFFFRMSWKIQTTFANCAVNEFPCWLQCAKFVFIAPALPFSARKTAKAQFRCLFETPGKLGVIISCEAEDISEEKALGLATKSRFFLPAEQLHLKKTHLFFPFWITTSSMHVCIFETTSLGLTDSSPSSLTGLLVMEPYCFSVRRRKLSCDRRDCEAGC